VNRPASPVRRALIAACAVAPALPSLSRAQGLPDVAALRLFVAGRPLRMERVTLDIPRIADNGNVIPVRLAVAGPFAPGAEVRSIHLFAEKNPVPQMAAFHFPAPVARVEVESRVRLAGTQQVAAVATLADGALLAATADVIVTISACIDGT
jgi:sulfur-oxidizing protein SoxY